jgi:hypothetical protein
VSATASSSSLKVKLLVPALRDALLYLLVTNKRNLNSFFAWAEIAEGEISICIGGYS